MPFRICFTNSACLCSCSMQIMLGRTATRCCMQLLHGVQFQRLLPNLQFHRHFFRFKRLTLHSLTAVCHAQRYSSSIKTRYPCLLGTTCFDL